MTELALKYRVGWLLILSHLLIITMSLILFFSGGFSFDELTTMMAVIVPMFAGYTTAIASFFVSDRFNRTDTTQIVTPTFIAFSLAMPVLFAGFIATVILLKAFNITFKDFEQFKETLVLIEALFAVYVGRFVYAMYTV